MKTIIMPLKYAKSYKFYKTQIYRTLKEYRSKKQTDQMRNGNTSSIKKDSTLIPQSTKKTPSKQIESNTHPRNKSSIFHRTRLLSNINKFLLTNSKSIITNRNIMKMTLKLSLKLSKMFQLPLLKDMNRMKIVIKMKNRQVFKFKKKVNSNLKNQKSSLKFLIQV